MIAVMAVYSARFPMLLGVQERRRRALEVDNQHDAGNRDARFSGAQEEQTRPAHQASGAQHAGLASFRCGRRSALSVAMAFPDLYP